MGASKAEQLGITVRAQKFQVSKARISFPLFYTLQGRQVWAPLRYSNAGMFYGEHKYWDTFIRNMTRLPNKEASFLEMNLYSFQARHKLPKRKYFHNFHIKTDLAGLIDELLLVRADLRAEAKQVSSRDPNRKLSILFLDLTEKELVALKDPALQEKLIALLQHAAEERLYFILLAQYAHMVPGPVIRALDWQAFMGETNRSEARMVYDEYDESTYNINRTLVGSLVECTQNLIIPLHDLVYEASEHKNRTAAVGQLEEQAYRDFLESLG